MKRACRSASTEMAICVYAKPAPWSGFFYSGIKNPTAAMISPIPITRKPCAIAAPAAIERPAPIMYLLYINTATPFSFCYVAYIKKNKKTNLVPTWE